MSGMSGDHSGIGGGGVMPPVSPGKGDVCLNLVIITPVVVVKDEEVLGTVLSSHLVQLLNCMNGGTEYEAEILKIDGAICQVKIRAVK